MDTGLLRKDEGKKVLDYYKEHFDLNIIFVDAKDRFLNKLKGVLRVVCVKTPGFGNNRKNAYLCISISSKNYY